jgi:transcriptional regulator
VATVRDDEKFVRGLVARLTRVHEASEPKPWRIGDAAPGYIDTMLKSIVGIEIRVERLVGKSKLSQNKDPGDRRNAADELAKRQQVALAAAMRNAG